MCQSGAFVWRVIVGIETHAGRANRASHGCALGGAHGCNLGRPIALGGPMSRWRQGGWPAEGGPIDFDFFSLPSFVSIKEKKNKPASAV